MHVGLTTAQRYGDALIQCHPGTKNGKVKVNVRKQNLES